MKVKFDRSTPALTITLSDDPLSFATDEEAELIVDKGRKLCAIRIWLKEVVETLAGEAVRNIAEHCVSNKWRLFDPEEDARQFFREIERTGDKPGESLEAYIARRRGDPDFRPWIFYQFSPLQGTLEIIDYAAILDISKERRRIAGIELVLTGRRVEGVHP